jgi:hypothetical protein
MMQVLPTRLNIVSALSLEDELVTGVITDFVQTPQGEAVIVLKEDHTPAICLMMDITAVVLSWDHTPSQRQLIERAQLP